MLPLISLSMGPRGPQRLPFRFILTIFHLPTCVRTHTQRTQEPHSVSTCGTSRSTGVLGWGWRGLELTWGRTGVRGGGQGERKSASCTERPSEITKSDLDVYLETSLSVFHCFCDKVPQIQWLKIAHIGTFLMA